MNGHPAGAHPRPEHIVIDADHADQRIDNFLVRHMKGVPRSHVYRVLRTGQVRVNRGRVRPDYRLQAGDRVRVPPFRGTPPARAAAPGRVAWLRQRILYSDPHLLVVNKPAGLAVHAGSGVAAGLIECVRAAFPQEPALELVHRLDRETSGCLLLARSRAALRALHRALREGRVDKRYLALVAGRWQGGEREVSAPLRRNVLQGGERMVQVSDEGRAATSRFRPVGAYRGAALVEISLGTGRTHQARVHAAHLGYPLAGDEKYGMAEFNRRMRELGLRRVFLHAHYLALAHPVEDRELTVSAPLEPELAAVLERLEGAVPRG